MRIFYTGQFKKDFRVTENHLKEKKEFRGELRKVITSLQSGKTPQGYTINRLPVKGSGWYDCYVYEDIVLIYRIHKECLILSRIGECSALYE